MSDCIFCKIANKEINPEAKIHILIVPKKHYETILDVNDDEVIKDIFKTVKEIAAQYDIDEKGFRIINNCKEDGGQTVMHVHFHMLAGEKLSTNII